MLLASISSGTTEPRRRGSRLPVGGSCGTAAADLHHRRILSDRHHARTPSARDRWVRLISIHQRHKEPFLSSLEDSRAMYKSDLFTVPAHRAQTSIYALSVLLHHHFPECRLE